MKRRNSCRGEPICKTPSRAAFFSAFLQLHALFNQCIHALSLYTLHARQLILSHFSLSFLSSSCHGRDEPPGRYSDRLRPWPSAPSARPHSGQH